MWISWCYGMKFYLSLYCCVGRSIYLLLMMMSQECSNMSEQKAVVLIHVFRHLV
jgi:hypothetical protein